MAKTNRNGKPAALYLRCSTDRQEHSTEDQRTVLRRFADQNGYSIVGEYCDQGVSGSSGLSRPQFSRMMDDAQDKICPYRYILTHDYSRFSRGDTIETDYYLYLLRERGIEVISATESFGDPEAAEFMRPLAQWQANQYIKNLSRDTIRGQVSRIREGMRPGGVPPFGYDVEYLDRDESVVAKVRYLESGEKLVFEPHRKKPLLVPHGEQVAKSNSYRARLVFSSLERVELVRRMFRMSYVEERGFKTIAASLNEERIPSPRDGNWSSNARACWSRATVRAILMNRTYTGDTVWNRASQGRVNSIKNGQPQRRIRPRGSKARRPKSKNDRSDWIVIPNTHPAIIDRETFECVQAQIAERGRSKAGALFRSGRSKDAPYLLTGLVECSNCSHPYYGRRIPKGKRRVDGTRVDSFSYVCSARVSKGKSVCAADSVPKDALEESVIEIIGDKVGEFLDKGGDAALEKAIRKELQVATRDPGDEMRSLEREIADCDREISTLVDDVLKKVDRENVRLLDRKLTELRERRGNKDNQLRQLRAASKNGHDIRGLARKMVDSVRPFGRIFEQGTIDEKRQFVQLFIEKVVVNVSERKAMVHIRKFPAVSALPGIVLLVLVAGVGFEPTTFGL